jgi:hypothetical protein
MFLELRNNLKSSGSSFHKCSISYSTLKHSFAPRILTTTSEIVIERFPLSIFSNSKERSQSRDIIVLPDLKCKGSSEYSDNMLTLCFDRYKLRARIWMIPAEYPPQPLQELPPPPCPFSCGQVRHPVIKSTRKDPANQECHLAAAERISP